MKFFFLIVSLFVLTTFSSVAQDESSDDAFDSLFEEAEDVSVSEANSNLIKEESSDHEIVIQAQNFKIPLNFSGHLESELGVGDIYEDSKQSATGYLSFENYLYFSARADKTFSVRGSIQTIFPSWDFSLYELYFDYLLFDLVYITAGKKSTTWGYVRLFSNDDNFSDEEVLHSNILHDSRDGSSVIVRIPVLTGTITGFALYKGTDDSPKMDEMSLAGSIEMIVFHTSVNLFGRKYPNDLLTGQALEDPIFGLEMKKTILGADVYTQGTSRIADMDGFRKFSKKLAIGESIKSNDLLCFSEMVLTAGLYRWWNIFELNAGFNFEFQDIYIPSEKDHSRRIALDCGLSRLGKNKNIKIGSSWFHNLETKVGYVEPGVIISGVLPHGDWKNGVKVEYGETNDYISPKITIGSTILLKLNY